MTLADQSVDSSSALKTIAIIGNGPVGVHFCNELQQLSDQYIVHIFGDEPYNPYNRVALSQLLYGEKTLEELLLPLHESSNLHLHWHTRIQHIDTENQRIQDNQGQSYQYDELVLCTGSRAHIPSIPGVHMTGVYCFRDMKDAEALMSRRVGSRHCVILGGGLLGIETARAMSRLSTKVTLIQHSGWLMNRQLDEETANSLTQDLTESGIEVRVNTSVMAVDGTRQLEGVLLRDGSTLECDTLILSTGIQPNIELAREANLHVGRGIRIDENLQTSVNNVYAIGECAEVEGEVYGLVAPGLEQAALLARRLTGNTEQTYQQRALSTRLKVLDTPVVSMGKTGQLDIGPESRFLRYQKEGVNRSLHFERGKLLGGAGVGIWPDQERLKDLIEEDRSLNPWQKLKFRLTGNIWGQDEQILDHHIICNCRQISAGELRACAAQGQSPSETGAGSVCGSCQPLLTQFQPANSFLGDTLEIIKDKGIGWQIGVGLLGICLIALFILTSPFISIPTSYSPGHISEWWTDSSKRQITGFTLLGLTTFSLLLTGRKRLKAFSWLSFSSWRGWHIVLTTLVLAMLFLHTGQSEFQGINQWLITSFWVTALLGLLTSVASWREQASPSIGTKRNKRWALVGHIIAFWPLPVLLSFHILSVYWY